MQRIIIYLCLLACTCFNGHSQGVKVNEKVRERSNLKVTVAAVLDTIKDKPAKIHLDLFVNGSFDSSYIESLKRDKDGWFSKALIDGPVLKKGIHSFSIKFSDSCTRIFQCLVTGALKNDTKNMIERQYLQSPQMYETLRNYFLEKVLQKDSMALAKLLPTGLKAALCIDFFGKDEICVTSQYLFAPADPSAAQEQQFFFRSLFKDAGIAAMDALLSLGWQLKPIQFNRVPTSQDIFSDNEIYTTKSPPFEKLKDKIMMGYTKDDKGFSRILLLINN